MVARSFFDFLDVPLGGRTRILLALLAIPIALSFLFPLWKIHMVAPQYPRGLWLDIYSYRLEAGHGGNDLREINILNHYIGMHAITENELRDLDWLPFGLGAVILLTLRVAALGNVRSLVDLGMIAAYISAFAFSRFVWMLWSFGHDLHPDAPVKVQPFTPAIIGTKKIANFTTSSLPQMGSACLFLTIGGIWVLLIWSLVVGRRRARAAMARGESTIEAERV
ncbi:MAG: hypothetical protein H6837_16805 [Planctomycetes bacterium]|nr:hypothetical protein [Planctomycetota bacterium]